MLKLSRLESGRSPALPGRPISGPEALLHNIKYFAVGCTTCVYTVLALSPLCRYARRSKTDSVNLRLHRKAPAPVSLVLERMRVVVGEHTKNARHQNPEFAGTVS